jgi:hydroxyethylthiazole kinase-like uncharacterized protein yjeF
MCPSPRAEHHRLVSVDGALLRALPLPPVEDGDTKRERGTVLVVGGSRETPGSVLLAGLAALRAGAGRLRIATVAGTAVALGVAIPEARVIGLPESDDGAIAPDAAERLTSLAAGADAVLAGTGALDPRSTRSLVEALLGAGGDAVVVLDAAALADLHEQIEVVRRHGDRLVLVPNPSEMSRMLGRGVGAGDAAPDPAAEVRAAAADFGSVVARRGADTYLGAPGCPVFVERAGHPALGTSGSGDVMAGVLTGFAARGAPPLRAALWAAHIHAVAGRRLARRTGRNLLARELLDELRVPQRQASSTRSSMASSK